MGPIKSEIMTQPTQNIPFTQNMETTVTIFSKAFMQTDCDSWSASPTGRILGMLHRLADGSARWIAVIGEGPEAVHVALGDPVSYHSQDGHRYDIGHNEKCLYLPQWILSSCELEGCGEAVQVRFERCENFVKAEKLGFQVVGSIPSDIDLRDLLEHPLSQLGVIRKGQIIPVPIMYGAHLILTSCEPDDVPVFLDGAEISLEIEGDSEEVSTPAPAPVVPEVEDEEEENEPVPMIAPAQAQSYVMRSPPARLPFIPFQGVGHRLGD